MQSIASLGHAVYRMVFRAGSPQRIQYSGRLLLLAIAACLVGTLISLRWFFRLSMIEMGLTLFTGLAGLSIAATLLTRKAPRSRLRTSLVALFSILTAAQLLLILAIPARGLTGVSTLLPVAAAIGVLLGTSNVLQYLMRISRVRAALTTLAFACLLGVFYAILSTLLETVFS
jgi:hypothetical protein